jgi:hypothetical protein
MQMPDIRHRIKYYALVSEYPSHPKTAALLLKHAGWCGNLSLGVGEPVFGGKIG